jgi:peptidoglycan/xylan/chitin deacetylase (PgdA/CDA1 family)
MRAVSPRRPESRILMYHAVGTPVPGDRLRLFELDPARFRAHVTLLAASRRPVRPLRELAADRRGGGVAITFDDGFRDTLHGAAPVLVDRGLPFTVFATAAYVRSGGTTYLSPGELRELASLPGVTVGAHGATHVRLTDCDDARLRDELISSRRYLEDLLQQPVTLMSYPHGAVDARVRAAAAAAGYTLAAGSRFGASLPSHDPLQLRRIEIWRTDDVGELAGKLRGDWDWRAWIPR